MFGTGAEILFNIGKVVCFTGETFKQIGTEYHASQTSVKFIQDMFGPAKVIVVGGVHESPFIGHASTIVNEENFIPIAPVASVKDFAVKSMRSSTWRRSYISTLDDIIDINPEATFWIRTPSPASILFGLRCLKKGKTVINHMCADSRGSWRDKKYSIFERTAGFFAAKVLFYALGIICKHKGTRFNLATGDILQAFSDGLSPANTYQFVDLMVQEQTVLDVRPNEFRILFVGRCVADKGIYELLDAVNEIPDVFLDFVGGGDICGLNKTIERYKITDRVKVLGQINHEDLPEYFRKASCVAIPSKNSYEGFPRVIMEAWAFGVIPIVSNVGGVKAFVRGNENALLIDSVNKESIREAVLQLKNSKSLRASLTEGVLKQRQISNQEYWTKKMESIMKGEAVEE